MNFKLKTTAAAILAVSLVALSANASDPPPPAKKHPATKKAKTPPGPTVEEQIQILRQEMQGQIDGLKTDLATKDDLTALAESLTLRLTVRFGVMLAASMSLMTAIIGALIKFH